VRANSTTEHKWQATVWQQTSVSQKVTYLHSPGYALFTPCLVYVRHEFKCRRARQLCAPGRGWILEVEHVVDTSLDRVDNIQLRESGLRRVGDVRMVQDSTQVIPRGCIVRRKRNLLFGKALKWNDVVRDNQGHRHGGRANCQRPLFGRRTR
jgi:hypothetical protein